MVKHHKLIFTAEAAAATFRAYPPLSYSDSSILTSEFFFNPAVLKIKPQI
jgi:hypothetical protein